MLRPVTLALALAATGCATGAPVGGRFLVERYEPFTRPAEGRAIPSSAGHDDARPLVLVAPGAVRLAAGASRPGGAARVSGASPIRDDDPEADVVAARSERHGREPGGQRRHADEEGGAKLGHDRPW